MTVTINQIEGLNLVNGSYTISYESLNTNNEKKVQLEFNCPSGEGIKERKFDLTGRVEYLDVINNKRQNPIGPYTIIVRAFRKSDELKDSLNKLEKSSTEILGKLNTFKTSDSEAKLVSVAFFEFYENQKESITKNISTGEFSKAESGIEILDLVIKTIGSNSSGLMSSYDDLVKSINSSKNLISNRVKESKNNISKVENLLTNFENKLK